MVALQLRDGQTLNKVRPQFNPVPNNHTLRPWIMWPEQNEVESGKENNHELPIEITTSSGSYSPIGRLTNY